MLIKLHIVYAHQPSCTVRVPDMGLTPREWAEAAFQATNTPAASRYDAAGAEEVDHALRAGRHTRYWRRGIGPGDAVEILGKRLRCFEVQETGSLRRPSFTEAQVLLLPVVAEMYVAADAPPPDDVAYVEDDRDRLWTGRGAGEWRCLTDPARRTASGQWAVVWREYGPLTPLLRVKRLDEPVEPGMVPVPDRAGRAMERPAF